MLIQTAQEPPDFRDRIRLARFVLCQGDAELECPAVSLEGLSRPAENPEPLEEAAVVAVADVALQEIKSNLLDNHISSRFAAGAGWQSGDAATLAGCATSSKR